MIKIEYQGIREIHDKFESIIANLRSQFSKFSEERDKREEKIRVLVEDITYSDLPLSPNILNFLEWDTSAILLEEQAIQTYEQYLNALFKHLKEIKNQKERIEELTEELDRKEEDLELMGDMIRKKDEELNTLRNDKEKLVLTIKKTKTNKQFGEIDENDTEVTNERSSLFNEDMIKPKKTIGSKRNCDLCGKDISARRTDAKYCVECYYINKKRIDKINKKNKRYNKKGDEVPIAEPEEQEENKEDEDTENAQEGSLDESADYEETGPAEGTQTGEDGE